MRPTLRQALAGTLGALCCAGALALQAPSADARMVMLYDTADSAGIMAGPGGLEAGRHNLFQQQPVRRVLAPERQAWKVAAGAPSRATPGLRGRSVDGMVSLLRDRIVRSGGRLVFIDEAGLALHRNGEDAINLATALEILSHQTAPQVPGQTLNERVHIYVQGIPAPLVRPDQWNATWRVLARAGGVWWQTYTSNRAWNEAEWATWSRLVQRNLVANGGDTGRLRWVIRHDPAIPMHRQFEHALTGEACAPLANGIGIWRAGPEAIAFREGYRAIADGLVACRPAPAVAPVVAEGLRRTTRLEIGARLPTETTTLGAHGIARLPAGAVPERVPARIAIDLGPDPLGIAASLGADPAAFWAGASASVRVTGPGIGQRVDLSAGEPFEIFVLPEQRGVVNLVLQLPVRAIREALGGAGVDLLGVLDSVGGAHGPALTRRLTQNPGGTVLNIPLRNAGGGNLVRVLPDRGVLPSRMQLLLPARLAGNRIAPRHIRPVATRLRDGRGAPVVGARAHLRLPGGRVYAGRSDARGLVRFAIPRRAGAHVLSAPGTRLRIVRRLGAPPAPARSAPRAAAPRGQRGE